MAAVWVSCSELTAGGLESVKGGFVAVVWVSCGGLTAAELAGAWVVSTGLVGARVGAAEATDWESPEFEVGGSPSPPQAAISRVIAANAATANGPFRINLRDCNVISFFVTLWLLIFVQEAGGLSQPTAKSRR